MISLKLLPLEEIGYCFQTLQLSTHLKHRVRMLSDSVARLDFLNPNNLICVLSRVYSPRRSQGKGYPSIELSSNNGYVSYAWTWTKEV